MTATDKWVMVVDTETTGLPPRIAFGPRREVSPRHSEAWERCRLVQIAWLLFDATGTELSRGCRIIRPEGFSIPARAAEIHGITDAVAAEQGVPLSQVWDELAAILPKVDTIVAHNLSFDHAVVASEMWRSMRADLVAEWCDRMPHRFCTMLRGCRRSEKWPRLHELYQRVVGTELDPAALHKADTDAAACAEIYWKMVKGDPVKGDGPMVEV